MSNDRLRSCSALLIQHIEGFKGDPEQNMNFLTMVLEQVPLSRWTEGHVYINKVPHYGNFTATSRKHELLVMQYSIPIHSTIRLHITNVEPYYVPGLAFPTHTVHIDFQSPPRRWSIIGHPWSRMSVHNRRLSCVSFGTYPECTAPKTMLPMGILRRTSHGDAMWLSSGTGSSPDRSHCYTYCTTVRVDQRIGTVSIRQPGHQERIGWKIRIDEHILYLDNTQLQQELEVNCKQAGMTHRLVFFQNECECMARKDKLNNNNFIFFIRSQQNRICASMSFPKQQSETEFPSHGIPAVNGWEIPIECFGCHGIKAVQSKNSVPYGGAGRSRHGTTRWHAVDIVKVLLIIVLVAPGGGRLSHRRNATLVYMGWMGYVAYSDTKKKQVVSPPTQNIGSSSPLATFSVDQTRYVFPEVDTKPSDAAVRVSSTTTSPGPAVQAAPESIPPPPPPPTTFPVTGSPILVRYDARANPTGLISTADVPIDGSVNKVRVGKWQPVNGNIGDWTLQLSPGIFSAAELWQNGENNGLHLFYGIIPLSNEQGEKRCPKRVFSSTELCLGPCYPPARTCQRDCLDAPLSLWAACGHRSSTVCESCWLNGAATTKAGSFFGFRITPSWSKAFSGGRHP